MDTTTTFKIVLVGDGAVGKTTYVKALRTAEFEKKYVATLGVEVHPVTLETTRGTIRFYMWDTAGQEKLGGLREGYYLKAHAVIAMYDDATAPQKNVANWVRDVKRTLGEAIPLVVIANKADLGSQPLLEAHKHVTYAVSTKTATGLYAPLLHLAKELMDDPTLELKSTEIAAKGTWAGLEFQ